MANLFSTGRDSLPLTQSTSYTDEANINTANTRVQESQNNLKQSLSILNKVQADNEAFFNQSQQAYVSATANNALNQATVDFANAYQKRLSQTVDNQGNPNFKSIPQDLQSIAQEIANKYTSSVNDSEVALHFNNAFKNFTTNQIVQSYSTARTLQENYLKQSLLNSQDHLANLASFGSTADKSFATKQWSEQVQNALSQGAITQPEATSLTQKFNDSVGQLTAEHTLTSDPYKALDIVQDPAKHGLSLSPEIRISLERAATHQIKTLEREQEIKVAEQQRQFDRFSEELQKTVESGELVDASIFNKFINSSTTPEQKAQAEALVKEQQYIQDFSLLPPTERLTTLNTLNPNSREARILSKINENLTKEFNKDAWDFAQKQGVIKDIKPLDFTKDLGPQLFTRMDKVDKAEGFYKQRVLGVSADELNQIKTSLDQANSADQKLNMIRQIQQGQGEHAKILFAKLGKETMASADTWAANMYVNGNQSGALKVMQGNQIAKDTKVNINHDDFNTAYTKIVPISSSAVTNAGRYSAIKAAYIHELASSNNLASDKIDKEALERAKQTVVGKPYNLGDEPGWGGNKTIYINENTDIDQFQKRLNNLSLQDLEAMGGLYEIKKGERVPVSDPVKTLKEATNLVEIGPNAWEVHDQIANRVSSGALGLLPLAPLTISGLARTFVTREGKPFVFQLDKVGQ